MKNYYEILGLSETATQDEIKKAYRKLSKQYHPDVNPDGDEKFKEIAEAYENIGDENKRRDYDNRKNNPFAGMGNGAFDIHSMFEQMMGMNVNRKPKAPDKTIEIEISPVESFMGVEKELKINSKVKCRPCDGSGGDKRICETCKGNGYIIQIFGTGMFKQQIQMNCNVCNGSGTIIYNPCKTCFGTTVINENETLKVQIPRNVDNGDFMRLKSKGDYYSQIKSRGDLILKVNLNQKDGFEKLGNDLIFNKKVNVVDLLLDDYMDIPHPEGNLNITLPEKIDTERPMRIFNKGYSTPEGRGNFYIKLSIFRENKINDEYKNKIKEILKQTV